jgi:uncharacterized protein (TIRG00374 family)
MKWRRLLPIIGIAIFIYLLIRIDLRVVVREIVNANVFYILLTIVFLFLLLLFHTIKWFVIARKQDIRIPFKESFKITLITCFYEFIVPSKLGTILRVEYMKKYASFGKGLCNFTLDKILDLSSIIFLAIIFSFVFKDKLALPIGFFILVFVVFIVATLFFLKKERSKFVLRIFFKRFVPEKMKEKAKSVFDNFYDHIPKKRYFPLFFILNVISWVIIYAISFFVGLSLGIDLPFYVYLGVFPIATLIALIPISINGLGTREVALVSMLSLFGVSAAKAFSMSIISFFITTIITAIIGSFLIWKIKS